MTPGSYNLEVLLPGDLIVATLAGFFTLSQVEVYTCDVEALIGRCSREHGGYRILVDISGCAIQSQDVTAAFGRHIANVPRARRVAVVTKSSILRMQIRRVVGRPELAAFDHVQAALDWLNRPPTRRAA